MINLEMKLRRHAVFIGLVLGCLLCAILGGYHYGERVAAASLQDGERHKLDLYVDSLKGELARYASLPAVIAQSQEVIDLMKPHASVGASRRVNDYLERVNGRAQATASYLMDARGLTIAASNWREDVSFVGMDFSYRPYFRDATKGLNGHFFAIGAAGAEPGYYFSSPILEGKAFLGVAAVKFNLDQLDTSWMRGGERLLVLDDNGIAFLSTVPAWRYKSLAPLPEAAREQLIKTRQYNLTGQFETIGFTEIRRLTPDAVLIEAPPVGRGLLQRTSGELYLAQTRTIPGTPWRVMVLSSIEPVTTAARWSAAIAALAVLFTTSLVVVIHQRRRAHVHACAARNALEQAKLTLEEQVMARTADLVSANEQLTLQMDEKLRAEQALKSATDGLVQAAKLATLGEMATGITHELNQPLAALRTLSDNTIKMIDRGLLVEARANLGTISQLVTRMARITGQLRKFARKTPAEATPVAISSVVADALFLLDQRIREAHVVVRCDIDADAIALCDANRLEQVLINLMSNAIDAMADQQSKVMTLVASKAQDHVRITVQDTGSGLAPEVRERLYEPFFSTKRPGAGLGLGLTISLGIVQEFGGSIVAATAAAAAPGAEFIVTLKAA